jgi:hypothetical protein
MFSLTSSGTVRNSFWNDPEYEGVPGWKADPSLTPRLNEFASESL